MAALAPHKFADGGSKDGCQASNKLVYSEAFVGRVVRRDFSRYR